MTIYFASFEEMRRGLIPIAGLLFLVASASLAQSVRTFVSTTGLDTNDCSRTAPCRTIGAAIALVNPNGEVVTLSSGGYGPFTINKGLSVIVPQGIHAAIAPGVGAGNAINVEAGNTESVTLRGLYLNNRGAFGAGIHFAGGRALHVDRCVVAGFSNGISTGGAALFQAIELYLNDTVFRDGGDGIDIFSDTSTALVILDRCRFENNNGSGIRAKDGVKLVAHEVVAAGNNRGFDFTRESDGTVVGNLDHCVATGNDIAGVHAGNDGTVRMTSCAITGNVVGVNVEGTGIALSLLNNMIEGNGTDVVGKIDELAPR